MYARVTQLEIDTLRVDVDSALGMYQDTVLPQVRDQPGYRGVLVLTTPGGAGEVVTFWDTAEQADASGLSGFYPELLERLVTIFRSPPGRSSYTVALADLPLELVQEQAHDLLRP